MIDKSFLEKIEEMSKPEFKEHDGKLFSSKVLHEVKKSATPDPKILQLHTLSGIIDYIKNKLDNEKKFTIHVSDYNRVDLYGEFEPEFGRRKQYLSSVANDFTFKFNEFYLHEDFMIALHAQFISNEFYADLIPILGKITDEAVAEIDDDGFTQKTSVKKGISRATSTNLPNPVKLSPRRTFPEIEQPESSFILRMTSTRGRGVELALFEASGGFWRIDCIQKIGKYLAEQLNHGNYAIIA